MSDDIGQPGVGSHAPFHFDGLIVEDFRRYACPDDHPVFERVAAGYAVKEGGQVIAKCLFRHPAESTVVGITGVPLMDAFRLRLRK